MEVEIFVRRCFELPYIWEVIEELELDIDDILEIMNDLEDEEEE